MRIPIEYRIYTRKGDWSTDFSSVSPAELCSLQLSKVITYEGHSYHVDHVSVAWTRDGIARIYVELMPTP